ncbi:hypothetical protein Vafri_13468 [Volvox africanus]|nr:hypothetical protein Vafri_13468 [Volvox africanus]
MCRYQQWMDEPCHLKEYIPLKHHTCMIRFRLCWWAIEVNRPNDMGRLDRKCLVCGAVEVEDEYHVLMECPAYHNIPQEIWGGGSMSEGNMLAVMSVTHQRVLAKALYNIYKFRGNRNDNVI